MLPLRTITTSDSCRFTSSPQASPSAASPWRLHRQHFERNEQRSLPPLPEVLEPRACPERSAALARMLARFQLGEAGEGRVAREIHQVRLHGINADYRRALGLFVKEEGRHARILALLVRALGGRLLTHQASHGLFRWCRRLLGVRFKLLVLLIAEVVGGELYATLARQISSSLGRAALDEMVADERHHLTFHADFLRGQARTAFARWVGRCALWTVGIAALTVVIFENRSDLAALGIDRRALAARVLETLRFAEGAAFVGPHRLPLTRAVAP